MKKFLVKITSILLLASSVLSTKRFPKDFLFGVASSAYQIEGGHNAEGKGESIWDYHLRVNPGLVADFSNGSIACDSYHKYQEDLDLVEDLGVNFYRFSIAWSRILPNGLPNEINPAGIRYYNNLIDGLIAKKITPMITMYHWDLPKKLQDIGGWTNARVADYFEDYATILFENFGDRVPYWITFNFNPMGYSDAEWPPLVNHPGGWYLYLKNVLLAHAKVYHLYKKKYNIGQIGFVSDGRWYEPATKDDNDAAERVRQFILGTIMNPLVGDGDFPQLVKERVENISKKEGFLRSRLPSFTRQEVDYIKGSVDFLGINVYTTYLVRDDENLAFEIFQDMGAKLDQDPSWPRSISPWLTVVPWGVNKFLQWFKEKYGDVPLFITENGYPDKGELEDFDRINYLNLYVNALLEAIHEDGANVKGYTVWSLLDNFEWLSGYSEKFGLYHVDFNDPNRKRTPKASAKWYKNFIQSQQGDQPYPKTEL